VFRLKSDFTQQEYFLFLTLFKTYTGRRKQLYYIPQNGTDENAMALGSCIYILVYVKLH